MCNNFNKKFIDEAAKALNEQNDEVSYDENEYMEQAAAIAIKGVVQNEGGPFGCIIVKDGEIIGRGNNKVTSTNDPTAHAEIIAIREACKKLDSFQLEDCIIYTSCEPCPMCLGAIYWARPKKVYYGCSKTDAAKIGFDDKFIYQELNMELSKRKIPFEQLNRKEAMKAFKAWEEKEDKIEY
ncbi:nucleoside deaminase [Lutimonas zeaxanthinifaciens]|uniref:nucleoside deaminase n=1 Tax=Lutimonas zeaxanthinifaciens TaxID=3060215 RepID=UPI00265CF2A4|nr:nucleoside deaminase [Lutimonas sp. YSD2104]WKK66895.1 nucleoside deaminase [Lutimonas sp. YSD2104]